MQIFKIDFTERPQLREILMTAVPENSDELEREAKWIYKRAFNKSTVSNRPRSGSGEWTSLDERKSLSAVGKIKQALNFLQNQQLEATVFYREEYVGLELDINDLWKVYHCDEKWCQLQTGKKKLAELYERVRDYQLDELFNVHDTNKSDEIRLIQDDDIDCLNRVQTPEELKDVHAHIWLHYAHNISDMQQTEKLEVPEIMKNIYGLEYPYSTFRKAGILRFTEEFGLTSKQFARNLRDNHQRHDDNQETHDPYEIAKKYVSKDFENVHEVLDAGIFAIACQISCEPMVRKSVRAVYMELANISVFPTLDGEKAIDGGHPIYNMKHLKNKPVRDFCGDQFLLLCIAEEEKLMKIHISESIELYLENMKSFYEHRNDFSENVRKWNEIRAECVKVAFEKLILPDFRKEVRSILLSEAKENVLRACVRKLNDWIKQEPYSISFHDKNGDIQSTKDLRIMGIAFEGDPSQATFCAMIDKDGNVTDYLQLPRLISRREKFTVGENTKPDDTAALMTFLRNQKPHVIAVASESIDSMEAFELQDVVKSLIDNEQFSEIVIKIINNDLAKVYAKSQKGQIDFPEFPIILRQAISVARRLRNPLIEFSQLCTSEILRLRFHPLQDYISKDHLLNALNINIQNKLNSPFRDH